MKTIATRKNTARLKKKKRCSFLLAVHRQASRFYNKTTTKNEWWRTKRACVGSLHLREMDDCSGALESQSNLLSFQCAFSFFFFFFFFLPCSLHIDDLSWKAKKKNEKSFRRWGGRREEKKYVKTGELREEKCRNEENKVVAATHQRLLASYVWKVRCTCLPFFKKLLTGQKEEKRWGKRG